MRIKTTFLLVLLYAIAQVAWAYDQEVSINSGNVTVPGGQHWLVTGTYETMSYFITLEDGATVTLSNVKIDTDHNNLGSCIRCNGSATVILAEGTVNTLKADLGCSALEAGPENKTLTIQGASTGTLIATGGYRGAGIGGRSGAEENCGNIVISGGNITAIGGGDDGYGAAGIGGDIGGNCGNITINGGIITAVGGNGAGDEFCGAAIGAGGGKRCGDITIAGGIINATGGTDAAAIGASKNGRCGAIIINGVCVVKATKGNQ